MMRFAKGNIDELVAIFAKKTDSIFSNGEFCAHAPSSFLTEYPVDCFKKRIDIGVMPSSNWYGAPNKIFEYGAAKIAVVAPSTPTIVDLFENYKDLLLFENESFDSLYNALLKLVEDKELLKSLAENLHGKIKKKYS